MCYQANNDQRLIIGLVFIFLGLVGMLCLTAGYIANKTRNNSRIKATCVFTAHQIRHKLCSYQCNCVTKSYPCGEIICHSPYCQTCYKDCYDGFVVVEIPDIVKDIWIYILHGDDDEGYHLNYLNTFYPIGDEHQCYYDNTTNTIRLSYDVLKNEQDPYIAGIVLCAFAGGTLLVWSVIELNWSIMHFSRLWANRKRDIVLHAPQCLQCNANRCTNIGSTLNPEYSKKCGGCSKREIILRSVFQGKTDPRFATQFIKTVIDMAK